MATDSADTFVDGVATRVPDPGRGRGASSAGAARIVTVSEDAAAEAMRTLFAATHNVAEPAGALALAGAVAEAGRVGRHADRVSCSSGGNVDTAMLVEVLSGRTPPPPSG